jgi:integrase
MPKRAEKLPRYYQRREDNGLLRVRVQVPASLIGRVLNDNGKPVRNLIYEFKTGSLREAQRTERRHDIVNGFHRQIDAARPALRLVGGAGAAVGGNHGQMVEAKRTVMVMRQPREPLDLLPGALSSRLVSRNAAEYIVHDMPVETAPILPAVLVAEYPAVIEHWARQQSIGPKGKDRMTLAMERLADHCGHIDMSRVTPDHLVAFKRALFAEGKKPKTVSNYLKDIRTLFGFAVANRDITTADPFEVQKKITFVAKRDGKATRLDFRPEHRQQILAGALASDDPVIKWINIVLLYSGMRLAEIAEAYTQDIWHFGAIPALHIDHEHRDENETLKTDESERFVPLHPSIVKLGFLNYVEWVIREYGHGPLFPMLKGKGKRSDLATQRIRKWFRFELGIKDPRRAPTHSHRHTIETILMEKGVRPDVAKRITGHLPEDIAEQNYTHYRVRTLFRAIKKIPDPVPIDALNASDRA